MKLSALLVAEPGDARVCFGRDDVARDRAELAARAGAVAERVAEVGGGRWLLHCEDAFAFAVGLFGIAHAGAEAVLLPNRQEGALLAADRFAQGVVLDGPTPASLRGVHLDPLAFAPGTPPREPLPLDAPLVQLSTSGTTGEGKSVGKSLGHLEAEVAVLERCFGSALGPDTRIFAAASPQHVYGLLFRVLWPLASARPFHAESLLHAEELVPRMCEAGDAALVSTPAHLRRAMGLSRARDACREVFSSGAPLDAETALRIASELGRAPVEVFGSTETGGVAWRRQGEAPARWTPLPGVGVSLGEGGRLVVESPFVSVGAPAGAGRMRLTMGDLAELAEDGSFSVRGRADRVLKIGEKRLSLPEMESELRRHPAVSDAALVALEQGGETRVGAVVVPSKTDACRDEELRRELRSELQTLLAARWDRVLLPRAWRFVPELPRDERGKMPASLLRALFEAPRGPVVLEETRETGSLVRSCQVPRGLAHLEGHFPGFPVVPGVVQLGWVVEALTEATGRVPHVGGVEALKFRDVMRPGQRFELRLRWDAGRARFELALGERVFASGRLVLSGPEAS